jgi:uridine kinase
MIEDLPIPDPAPESVQNLWIPADAGPGEATPAAPPAFVLGIVGDSGSGKNTVADAVEELLGRDHVTGVRLDDYHRFTREERAERKLTALNPVVHNLALMQEHLRLLRQRRPIRNRSYSHADGTFGPIRMIEPNDIVLVRGLLGFPTRELQSLYDLAVFLDPEPELLFRWKLRRDVLFRGYKQAEVLKYIAQHLLDSKEFISPQAERAHVLVHYELPDWDAPDSEVLTLVRLRREAADLARRVPLVDGLPVTQTREGDEIVITIPAEIPQEVVDAWARERFGDRYEPGSMGIYHDQEGELQRRSSLALVEVLVADLAVRLSSEQARSPGEEDAPAARGGEAAPG